MKEFTVIDGYRAPRRPRAPVPLIDYPDYSDFDPDRPGIVIAVMMSAFTGFILGAASVILTQYAVLFTDF